jgi:hypothetical protein
MYPAPAPFFLFSFFFLFLLSFFLFLFLLPCKIENPEGQAAATCWHGGPARGWGRKRKKTRASMSLQGEIDPTPSEHEEYQFSISGHRGERAGGPRLKAGRYITNLISKYWRARVRLYFFYV